MVNSDTPESITEREEQVSSDSQQTLDRRVIGPDSGAVEHVAVHDPEDDSFKICNTSIESVTWTVNGTTTLTPEEAADFALFVLETHSATLSTLTSDR